MKHECPNCGLTSDVHCAKVLSSNEMRKEILRMIGYEIPSDREYGLNLNRQEIMVIYNFILAKQENNEVALKRPPPKGRPGT